MFVSCLVLLSLVCCSFVLFVVLVLQSTESSLLYVGFQVLMLEEGQDLNQHVVCHNHPDFPNHTLNFGKFSGGRLEMLRGGAWTSYARTMVWLSFDALKVVHKVTPVSEGVRYSVTLHTPGKLGHLTSEDWDCLGRVGQPNLGFPTYLCDPDSVRMRGLVDGRLDPPTAAVQFSELVEEANDQKEVNREAQIRVATTSKEPPGRTDPLQNIPLPSIADEDEQHVSDPKTPLKCCRCGLRTKQRLSLKEALVFLPLWSSSIKGG